MKNLIKDKFDIIVLSLVVDESTYNVTKTCVDSYNETANDIINKIYVVETNSQAPIEYGWNNVEVIKPNLEFNYNQFYNIALERCEAEYIFGPNNDLIVHENCLQTILKEFQINSAISSISPIDRRWPRHNKMYLPTDNKLYYGENVSLHVLGCAFGCRRTVFQKIGFLDERFFFFYQDNDYITCLKRHNLLHGVHTGAAISHFSGRSDEYAAERLRYTPTNMNEQGDLWYNKWHNEEPFKSGGYKKYKNYEY